MKRKKLTFGFVVPLVILCFCEWFFFRNVLGTDALISDRGDGRLTNLLTEHWWLFFTGQEGFNELPIFYPINDVLGYTDLLFGYGVIHSVLRLFGFSVFLSYKYTLIIIHVMGTASMYYLMRRKLHCNTLCALFGTIAFCFSSSYALHLGHTQLNAIAYLPVLVIFLIGFIRNFHIRRIRDLYAYAFIFWFVLITYTAWYVACFTGLFILIFLVVYFLCIKLRKIKILPVIKDIFFLIKRDIPFYILFTVILYIPFILVYLPVFKNSKGYLYGDCTHYLPELQDLINVGKDNFFLGKLLEKIRIPERNIEVVIGFSIILLLVFLAMIFVFTYKNHGKVNNADPFDPDLLIMSVFLSVIVGNVLVIRFDESGTSLWFFVYKFLPVVRSMRAVARFLLWLSFPMAVITAVMADRYVKFECIRSQVFSCFVIVLLFISNIRNKGVSTSWNLFSENSFINNVAVPPEDAKVFYIIDSAKHNNPSDVNQLAPYDHLDAHEIAVLHRLKTINGYSGQFPAGWGEIWNIYADAYEENVMNWIDHYQLTDVYAYDRDINTWISIKDRLSDLLDSVYSPEDGLLSVSYDMKDYKQEPFAWTGRNAKIIIQNSEIQKTGLVIKMRSYPDRYLKQNPELDPEISIYVDGEFIQNVPVIDDFIELNIPMGDHESDMYSISIKTNCYFIPKDIGLNSDTRELSLVLYYIGN